MYVATSTQMKEVDEYLIQHHHYSILDLIEMASERLFFYVHLYHRYLILVGPGNNGADALSLAKRLVDNKKQVSVFFYLFEQANENVLHYYHLIKNDIEIIKDIEDAYEVVIDGLFGSGLNRPLETDAKRLLGEVNDINGYKVAIDVPTGISEDDLSMPKFVAFEADITITFMALKTIMLNTDFKYHIGIERVEGFGIEKEALERIGVGQLFDFKKATSLIKKRNYHDHKGMYGRITHLTGSSNYVGAACMAAKASVYTGSGVVRLMSDQEVLDVVCHHCMEVITQPIALNEDIFKNQHAILCGCGKGWNNKTQELVEYLLTHAHVPVILDADAINVISENPKILLKKKCPVIMTPHLGEFDRLCPKYQNLHEAIRNFSDTYDVIMVVKGANTLVYYQNEMYYNASGNATMASAGMGDVLAGVISSLCGQGYLPFHAATLGVFIHGDAGDVLCKKNYTSIPEKLIEEIPHVMKEIYDEKDFDWDDEPF